MGGDVLSESQCEAIEDELKIVPGPWTWRGRNYDALVAPRTSINGMGSLTSILEPTIIGGWEGAESKDQIDLGMDPRSRETADFIEAAWGRIEDLLATVRKLREMVEERTPNDALARALRQVLFAIENGDTREAARLTRTLFDLTGEIP